MRPGSALYIERDVAFMERYQSITHVWESLPTYLRLTNYDPYSQGKSDKYDTRGLFSVYRRVFFIVFNLRKKMYIREEGRKKIREIICLIL